MKMKTLASLTAAICMLGTVQSQTILDDAKVHIKFDEQSSEVIPKESVKGKKLVIQNGKQAPTAVNDPEMGWMRQFSSNDNTMIYPHNLPVFGTQERTLTFWVNLDPKSPNKQTGAIVNQNNAQIMFTSAPAPDQNTSLMVAIMNGKTVRINPTSSPTNKIDFVGDGKNLFGGWHHVALVIAEGAKASEIKCYVDGVDYGASRLVDAKMQPVEDFVCNTNSGFLIIGHSFCGKLSEIALFGKALSADEVKQVMTLTK